MNPINLGLRFTLELAALAGVGFLAWSEGAGFARYLSGIAASVAVAAVWGIFAVPEDPSRSGHAPVPVPGALRLLLELVILFGGALAFYLAGQRWVAAGLAILIVAHYAFSRERITWLLHH